MIISVIGAGRVGLVTAAGLSEFGHEVVCYDSDPSRSASMSSGSFTSNEPMLEDLVSDGLDSGRLRFTSDVHDSINGADVVFVQLGSLALDFFGSFSGLRSRRGPRLVLC